MNEIVYRNIHSVYTQLFAGFSEDVKIGKVDWIKDWGESCFLPCVLRWKPVMVKWWTSIANDGRCSDPMGKSLSSPR